MPDIYPAPGYSDFGGADLDPRDFNPTEFDPTNFDPRDFNPIEFDPANPDPTNVVPGDIILDQPDPNDFRGRNPREFDPSSWKIRDIEDLLEDGTFGIGDLFHIPDNLERAGRGSESAILQPPAQELDYHPTQACPGTEITVPLPESYEFISASFLTANGTAAAEGWTEGNELKIRVPHEAISGTVEFAIDVPFTRVFNVGPIEVHQRDFSPINTIDFKGGVSGIADFRLQAGRRRRRVSGEELNFTWRASNLDAMQIQLSGPMLATQLHVVDPTEGHFEAHVPEVSGPTDLRVAVQVAGPCPHQVAPFMRTFTPLDVLINRSPGFDPSIDTRFPFSIETVGNFYRNQSAILRVAYPESVDEVISAVRTAEFERWDIGARSTGGSYENITFPDTSDGTEAALIDPISMLLPHGYPGQTPEADRGTTREEKEAFREIYEAYLIRHARYVDRCASRLRNIMRPRGEIRSVIADHIQATFTAQTGVPITAAADRMVYLDAATRISDVEELLRRQPTPLMMPTAGASGFQSLAGAVTTGVHGSTRFLPPIAGFVRAIHVVSNEGYEWWIEPSSSARRITDEFRDLIPLLAAGDRNFDNRAFLDRPDIEIRYDNTLFDAALTGPGGVGIVCGYVLEALPPVNMLRELVKTNTAGGISYLADVVAQRGAGGTSWFPSATFASNGVAWLDTRTLSDREAENLPSGGLAGGTGGVIASIREHVRENVLEDFTGWMNRKFWKNGYSRAVGSRFQIDGVHTTIVSEVIKGNPTNLVRPGFEIISGLIQSFVSWNDLDDDADDDLKRSFTSHEFVIDGTSIVDYMNELMTYADEVRTQNEHDRADILNRIYDQSTPHADLQEALAEREELITQRAPLVFQANVRFTAETTALLGMQRWPLSAHIEIFSHADLGGSGPLWKQLEGMAARFNACPHWGQRHESHNYRRLYPITAYQRAMEPLHRSDGTNVFESGFGSRVV